MKRTSVSEKLLIEEVTNITSQLFHSSRGLSIGSLIKSIRVQLGMSQRVLASRSRVPQPAISRIEQGKSDINLSTLQKILSGISCELVIAPFMPESIDCIRKRQARKIAKKQVGYLKGTMNLEDQQLDKRFTEELVKEEEKRLLHGSGSILWES
ncbi:hypothetical protein COB11_06530 [Candidatus Aerophobetes bacterium]|uniref:HTH cro/C1-type domain-containing protein n=1 Tax=Aerophobetes bacterium TaxID=2030807 RepID=A0A2A4YET5_UNCAE|nr:MAG: hypothetical protein COB11_06530 [Candidatus Aerophobetes bacterium]